MSKSISSAATLMEEGIEQTKGPISEYKYSCNYCGICRPNRSLIISHILSRHQDELNGRNADDNAVKEVFKSFFCEKCGVILQDLANLKVHMRDLHIQEECKGIGLNKVLSAIDLEKLREQLDTLKMECCGIPLMEVFNVIYLSRDKVKPEKQHGTIELITDSSIQYLYNVSDVDTMSKPSIKYRDDIVVTVDGPTHASEVAYLKFDLFCGAYKGVIEVRWCSYQLSQAPVFFEERRIQSRDGTGEIAVLLGQFAIATVASLKVKLTNSAATNVYGVVAASNSKLDHPNCTSVLFVKKDDNKIEVGADGVIPLSRSCVGVPLDSVLFVDISLHVNGQPYTATVSFNAQKTGKFEVFDSENDPMICVEVNWDVNY